MSKPKSFLGIPVVVDPSLPDGAVRMVSPEAVAAAQRRTIEAHKRVIEALFGCGFIVQCGDVDQPVATLPARFATAFDEIMDERDNRDPAENFYRDRLGRPDLSRL